MRKTLFILLLLLPFIGYSQYSFTAHKHKYFKQFKANKTIVFLTGDEVFDEVLKEAVDKHWKHTEYQFADAEDERKYNNPDKYNFLSFFGFSVEGVSSNGWAVYLPDLSLNSTRMTNVIAYVPIDYSNTASGKQFGEDKDIFGLFYKIEVMIKGLVDVINFVEQEKYRPTLAHVTGIKKFAEKYNKTYHYKNRLKKKTLLISERILDERFTLAKLKKAYPHKIKVLPQEEYEALIFEKPKEYVGLFSNHMPNKAFFLYDFEQDRITFMNLNIAGFTTKKALSHQPKQFSSIFYAYYKD